MNKTNLFNCVSAEYYIGIIICLVIVIFFAVKITCDIKRKRNIIMK